MTTAAIFWKYNPNDRNNFICGVFLELLWLQMRSVNFPSPQATRNPVGVLCRAEEIQLL